MVKYVEAIKWPFSDWKKLAIGTAVSIVPIVHLLGTGYELECAKLAMKKKTKHLPEWENWANLFISGFLASLIRIIYILPGAIIMFASIVSALSSIFINSLFTEQAVGEAIWQAILNNWGLFLIGAIIALIGLYFSPMAVMNYAATGKFTEAFDFGTVVRKTMTGTYFVTVLFALGYALLIAVPFALVSALLSVTIVLPLIIDAFVSIVLGITIMSTFGQVYKETD